MHGLGNGNEHGHDAGAVHDEAGFGYRLRIDVSQLFFLTLFLRALFPPALFPRSFFYRATVSATCALHGFF